MYVARRAFRNYGQMILPGSIVEPGSTKMFKTRLKDRTIVEVGAHNFEQWKSYFKDKFGVDLEEQNKPNEPVEMPKEEPVEVPKEDPAKATTPIKKKVVTVQV